MCCAIIFVRLLLLGAPQPIGDGGRLDTKTGQYVYGYAKHRRDALPGASFIGFTGTPIEKVDANTQETFGGYVSIYDIEDAKEDKATVPIYYESRLAKLDINREEIDRLNKDVEEVIEDEEDVSARESTKGKWAELAKLVGAKERVEEIAAGSGGPSCAHLYDSGKLDDLVRYQRDSGVKASPEVMETSAQWKPAEVAPASGGKELFAMQCAACHGPNGLGNGPLSLEFARKPANLVSGPFVWTPAGESLDLRIARVIKFGLVGTDMPGHEVLTDAQVLALKEHVLELRAGRTEE